MKRLFGHPTGGTARRWIILAAGLLLAGCTFGFDPNTGGGLPVGNAPAGDDAEVTWVIDGDTIDVNLNGQTARVRYIGVNTPERDEACYREATQANMDLVKGKTVRLVKDRDDLDPYGRLLRYVYVGDVFVNRALVENGWAEAVLYAPNDAHYDEFRQLEGQARDANRGCHPTGIFNDGSDAR